MIFSHKDLAYQQRFVGRNRFNGAYYYSREIIKNFIPYIKTDYNWVTVNIPGRCWNHSIFFVHNNLHPDLYDWLRNHDDLILVCGLPETAETMAKRLPKHCSIYLPLSIDTEYVDQFRSPKSKNAAFCGRLAKQTDNLPNGIDIIGNIPREEMLKEMAKYETVYAVGRTALEAKSLGCKIGVYDSRFPDPDFWVVKDNSEARQMLQERLKQAKNSN